MFLHLTKPLHFLLVGVLISRFHCLRRQYQNCVEQGLRFSKLLSYIQVYDRLQIIPSILLYLQSPVHHKGDLIVPTVFHNCTIIHHKMFDSQVGLSSTCPRSNPNLKLVCHVRSPREAAKICHISITSDWLCLCCTRCMRQSWIVYTDS